MAPPRTSVNMASMSPRLPSPPPAAEDQIGPKSPGLGGSPADQETQQMEQTALDANAKRRIHPGTKSSDMAAGPPLVPLNEVCPVSAILACDILHLASPRSALLTIVLAVKLDSAFQLQEHLAALHYHHTAHNTQPITRDTAALLATPPPSIDRNLWLYELCRFLIAQCNSLIVGFLFDTPPCSFNTCPEMRASEWQFLCAVHEQPKSCCAIDYCCHTLDWAANVVTNPKLFPSRFVAPGSSEGPGQDRGGAVKNLVNVFRRLHRIFAHAWFQHRGVFWSVEGQTGLYVFFKTVCDIYDTLPAENYKLPPEAEGLESAITAAENMERGGKKEPSLMPAPTILQRSEDDSHLVPGRTNTRRHIRGSPSTGSAVTTVMEADEDESADVTGKLGDMHISAPEIVEEESEVPIIVEQGMMEEAHTVSMPQDEAQADRSETTTHEEPLVSELEIQADEAPKPELVSDPEEADKPEGNETAVEAQVDGQEEVSNEEDEEKAQQVEKSEAHDPAGSEAEVAATSTHDFAEDKEGQLSEATAEPPVDCAQESDKPPSSEDQDS